MATRLIFRYRTNMLQEKYKGARLQDLNQAK
jgi:hypothetical protein